MDPWHAIHRLGLIVDSLLDGKKFNSLGVEFEIGHEDGLNAVQLHSYYSKVLEKYKQKFISYAHDMKNRKNWVDEFDRAFTQQSGTSPINTASDEKKYKLDIYAQSYEYVRQDYTNTLVTNGHNSNEYLHSQSDFSLNLLNESWVDHVLKPTLDDTIRHIFKVTCILQRAGIKCMIPAIDTAKAKHASGRGGSSSASGGSGGGGKFDW